MIKKKIDRRDFMKTAALGTMGISALPILNMGKIEIIQGSRKKFPFRQIHLDFHTSRYIKNVGAEFDPLEFVSILKKAHINSVTCFGRCHHGFMYYNSKLYPERVHPYLVNKNLLKEQVDICHKNNIRVPIYVTVQWDHYTAREHPEWLMTEPNGNPVGQGWFEDGFYRYLDVYSPYGDFLKKSIAEMFEIIGDIDGLFLDIIHVQESSNKYCRQGMRQQGLDPENAEHRRAFYKEVIHSFKQEMTSFIHRMDKDVDIFYNSGHIGFDARENMNFYSHFELESLPSGGWGYLNFPITSRYARTLGKQILGMTGKFHTSWGDFHSFKNKASLEYEIFTNLALGAKCSIGDQLLPNGKLDPVTYNLIGSVYSQVEKKEPWCDNIIPVTEIGLFTTEEFQGASARNLPFEMMGAVRMLQEGQKQFDIIDSKSDINKYKLLIFPDRIPINNDFAVKIKNYMQQGGKVLATFESGLDNDKNDFVMKEWGVKKISDGPIDAQGELARGKFYFRNNYAQYIIPSGYLGKDLPETEHVLYIRGLDVQANKSNVLLNTIDSLFDRNYDHFCSHRQSPSSGNSSLPAVMQNDKVTYFAHPIFTQYYHNTPKWVKTLFLNAVDNILETPIIQIDGPSTILSMLNEQQNKQRYVLHLLHYIPEQRGRQFEVVEDIIPLHNLKISLNLPKKVNSAKLVPEDNNIKISSEGKKIALFVPKLEGHQMIELSY
jgi:hypothetical protein